MKSVSRLRTGCHRPSHSHHATTNTTVTTPPVMCTENTPSSASTASGMRSRCRSVDTIRTMVGAAMPYAAMFGIDAVSNSTYGTAVNDADRAAAAAADAAARHWSVRDPISCHVSIAALAGNSQTAAAREFSV